MRARDLRALFVVALLLACAAATPHAQQADTGFGRTVTRVVLEAKGHPAYSQDALVGLDVRKDQPFTYDAMRNAVQRLTMRGFDDVSVVTKVTTEGVEVTFLATPPHPLKDLDFLGDTGLLPEELRKRIMTRYSGLPNNVGSAVVNEDVIALLRDEGYTQATSSVTVRNIETPVESATLVFTVGAGPLATISKVTIENKNESAITAAEIARQAGVAEGRPYRPRELQESVDKLGDRLKAKGYYTAVATVQPESVTPGQFDITLFVDAGPLVVLQWDPDGDAPPAGDLFDFVPAAQQASIDDDMLNDADQRIKAALRREGYNNAEVTHYKKPAAGRLEVFYTVKRGSRFRVDKIDVAPGYLLGRNRILDLFGVRSGDVYELHRKDAGVARIINEYRNLGYYRVTVQAEPLMQASATAGKDTHVVIPIKIDQGPRGMIRGIVFERATTNLSEPSLRDTMRGKVNQPYVASDNRLDEIALATLYADSGYLRATVSIVPQISDNGASVTRVVRIDEHQLISVLDIQVVGSHDISETAIREELTLYNGGPFGEAARRDSQQRISGMGVFRTVSVEPESEPGPNDTGVHVIVRVVEAPDTTISYGGGVEADRKARAAVGGGTVDRFELAPRGFFAIGRRNLGGRNRAIDFFGRVSIRPRDAAGDPVNDGRGYRFSEYRAALTYGERRVFGSDTDWLFSLSSEQAVRSTFNFTRQSANVEFLRQLTRRTTATARFSVNTTRLSNIAFKPEEELDIDRAFPRVRLSIFTLSLLSDHRDNSIAPTRGRFFTCDTELALRALGSEVAYTKSFAQISGYRSLTGSRRFVAAARGELGMAYCIDCLAPDLPASQRFFAGGSTTVRGFQLDRLGSPSVLTATGLSLGGNALVLFNAELRTLVTHLFRKRLTTVQFIDSGNVYRTISDVRLRQMRTTVGFGIRYDSPLGPIRLDFGFKLSRKVYLGVPERGWEYHLSFGEAF